MTGGLTGVRGDLTKDVIRGGRSAHITPCACSIVIIVIVVIIIVVIIVVVVVDAGAGGGGGGRWG